ncbi:Serine/threonine-protein kinase tel1, partial [Coemansia sp. RSA 1365]
MTGTRRRIGVVPSTELVENASSSYSTTSCGGAVASQMRLIESTKATDRARGVQELADILREDAHGKDTLTRSIRSNEWESVLSWTAGILIKESQSFANKHNEEWPHMSATADRLRNRIQTQYSGYIRHIWVAAMPHLSTKLARFLIKHITDSLASDPCVGYVFGLDYAKVLRAWAVQEQHVYNCKDSRAKAIVDLCINTLSRFNGVPESQNSSDSLPSQLIQPGDTELATTLHALVAAATPARLAGMSEAVMEFCTEYCRFHTRENACMPVVLDTANIILLALADTQLSKNPERLKSMLSSSLQLWSTRTAVLKRTVLYNIRILTRLMSLLVTESGDSEARALLELVHKTMTSGAWDKHKFMTLPRDLLRIWPLLHTPSKSRSLIVPLRLLAPLNPIISSDQAAFFDTVAFLATYLTCHSSGTKDDLRKHRRKRARTAPTSLSRLLTEMGSGDSPEKSRGAAQLIWYISAVYARQLGDERCTELLQDVISMIQSSDLSQRGDLAEWMLGILRLLSPWDIVDISHSTSILSEDIWQHATAGVEAGLAGAAGLVFDVLHKQQRSSHEVHRQCRQAADALVAHTGPYDADSARLLLFLSQYVRSAKPTATDESLAQLLSKSIMQLCEGAAKQRWSLSLFSVVISQVLGFSDPRSSISDHISNCLVLDPDWNTELRFTQVLQTLALLTDSAAACDQLLRHHLPSQKDSDWAGGFLHPPNSITVVSNVFPAQWHLICERLLRFVEQVTSFEVGQLLGVAVPYIAHTIWRICGHLSASLQKLDDVERSSMPDVATQITDGFSERFLAFVAESKSPELVWQTMVFISPWTDGYICVAALEGPTGVLLNAMFNSGDARLLCDMAMGDSGSRLAASPTSNSSASSSKESQIAATTSRLSIGQNIEDRIMLEHKRLLEVRMLSTTAGAVQVPYSGVIDVLSALVASKSDLTSVILSRIEEIVDQIDGPQLLVASELILRCVLLDGPLAPVGNILGKLKERMLAFLDNESYTGHMPTLFAVLRVMQELVFLSKDVSCLANDEDLPRFVAWLDADCRQGRIDACIEIEFVRALVGPWSLSKDNAYASTLSVLDKSPTDILLSCAQTARSPVTRLVAEEQLAQHGLSLSFVDDNGAVTYPIAPEIDVAEDLILMTRDFGLALLICSSGSMVPGALSILLKQISTQSGCPQNVVRLCHRLLDSIARIVGFPSVGQAIGSCASDILTIDPELADTIHKIVESQISPEALLLVRTHTALEWMLRRDFSRCLQILPAADDVDKGEWIYWLLAQLMAMSVYDSALYSQLTTDVLKSHFASNQLQQIVREQPIKIILQLIMLHRPEHCQGGEIEQILAAAQASKDNITFTISVAYEKAFRQQTTLYRQGVPRWGRRYGAQLLYKAIARIADQNQVELHNELLTESNVVWLVLQLESQLQSACCDDRREQVTWALCQLVTIVSGETLGEPLLQAVLRRVLADNWLCGHTRTATQFCLTLGMVLDIVGSEQPTKQIGEIAAGFASKLAKEQGKTDPRAISECADTFVALLTAVSTTQTGNLPDDPEKLFVGSSLERLCKWEQLSAVVLTRSAVHHLEDRLALAQIAKRAAQSLGDASRTSTSAEMIAAAVERVIHLALVQDSTEKDVLDAGAMDDDAAELDLAGNVVETLAQVRHAAVQHMRGTSNKAGAQERTLLLRAVSLLETVETDVGRDATVDSEQHTRESSLVWHIGRVVASSHSLRARAAAIDAARAAASAETEWLGAEWLDAQQRRVLRSAAKVPLGVLANCERPGWLLAGRAPALDGNFLGNVCATGRTAESAVSELVCGLACGAGPRFQAGLGLLWEDAQTAVQMLPQVVHGALEQATEEKRAEIAAVLLDFAYNWRQRAAWMARAVVGQLLAVRQTDMAFSDVRNFFTQLPLGLFELADLAAELEMGDTAAFLLECDLTCTGAGRTVNVAGITGDARALLRRVYAGLGNAAAAQLLDSVATVSDVMRRCRDSGDWHTLLLYQEAVGGKAGAESEGFSTGDTLVRLGLLNSAPAATDDASAAAYAAAWRLGRWDLPALPQASEGRLLATLDNAEEALYGVLRRRAGGQVTEATAAVQALLGSAQAVEAVTLPARAASDRWAFRAVAVLLPLAAGDFGGALGRTTFAQASGAAAAVLAWSRGDVDAASLEPMHQANVALHERRLEAQVASDRREREALRASIDGFLRLAMWALTQSLSASDAFDDDVYTLVALVATHERAPEMQRTLSAGLAPDVPSRKFLPLARQLCGRLGGEGVVAAGVAALARRMTIDYPFHVVPLLLALRSASARRGAPDGGALERQRSSAAARLVTDAAATSTELRSVISNIDSLCSAYIELAATPVPERMRGSRAEGRVVPFGARLRIAQLLRAPPPGLPVLTVAPKTGAPRDYACVPFVMSAAPGYTLAGGVNLPKITRLLGDDGWRHKQLVKGRDDLRQDAVIQQLFALFNRCMRGPARATRPLRLRTYQVVPLTPRAGLLQWVDNTVPLGTWFRTHEAAYRPNSPTSVQLRATVHAVHRDDTADASRRRAVFDRVCEQAPPIFRFFFFENFAAPSCWYARRDTYIRSAAAASIAGWALGIGDRHLQNILVDHKSAELVHIDLGIAFDLGRLLPIPELVPFRLTRELVDGMGLLGLDATFRHACHAALHAMRDNARVVSTILNVLKVDPLYMWSLIPQRLDKINRSASMAAVTDSDADTADAVGDIHELDGEPGSPDDPAATVATEENQEAARSIMHVSQRLSATISVEGQVSELIQQATDPNLLSRMFEGWS